MRAIEERLTDRPTTLADLAADVYGHGDHDFYVEREHIESVRRASNRLAELGRAELDYETLNTALGGWGPCRPREHLTVRRPR